MIKMRWNLVFFDDTKIVNLMDRADRKALSRIGANIRQTARQSIRNSVGPSRPGRPPRNATGLLKEFLFFGYDPFEKTVVIGPSRLRGFRDTPHRLEFGGVDRSRAALTINKRTGHPRSFLDVKRRDRSTYKIKKGQTLRIEPRPFMGPAFVKELPDMPEAWRGSLRGGGGG